MMRALCMCEFMHITSLFRPSFNFNFQFNYWERAAARVSSFVSPRASQLKFDC